MRVTIPKPSNVLQHAKRSLSIPQVYKFLSKPFNFPEPTSTTLSTPDIISKCSQCEFPQDKQLDTTKQLNNTKAVHWKHVLIHSKTKAKDWQSKVELMPTELISEFGKHKRHLIDSQYPVLISNVELELPDTVSDLKEDESMVLVYPDNKYYKLRPSLVESFMKLILTPISPKNSHSKSESLESFESFDNKDELVLICGHSKRDIRCGLISEFLVSEFKHNLRFRNLKPSSNVKVGLISHIGGHAYAGNVLYFDKRGLSLWYGRVFPQHVDSLVRESIVGENIITDLYRGRVPENI